MIAVENMILSHPSRSGQAPNSQVAPETLASAIESLHRCAQICSACADACLGEPDVAELIDCIRTDLDCADVCQATASVLIRQTQTDWALVSAQLDACIAACRICAESCRRHAEHHEHCRICAEACAECEAACQKVLASIR